MPEEAQVDAGDQSARSYRVRTNAGVVASAGGLVPLQRQTEVVEHRVGAGGLPTVRSPGRTWWAPVELQDGVVHDEGFAAWAAAGGATARGGAAPQRLDLLLDASGVDGTTAATYRLHGCWPSLYEALPVVTEDGALRVALHRLVLEVQWWRPVAPGTELPADPT